MQRQPVNFEFEAKESALAFDITQPYVFDNSCFAKVIIEEVTTFPHPKIIEFGCGTGLLALKVLAALQRFDYHGLDGSPAMVQVLSKKLEVLGKANGNITLTAPIDLRRKTAFAAFNDARADIILMSQFLYYIPSQSRSQDFLSKEEFLVRCSLLTNSPGRIYILEDVPGETEEEHRELVSAWDNAVHANYQANFSAIQAALTPNNRYVSAVKRMVEEPSLIRIIREKRRSARGEQILPLSMWKKMLQRIGTRYRVFSHDSLKNFYMFVIDC